MRRPLALPFAIAIAGLALVAGCEGRAVDGASSPAQASQSDGGSASPAARPAVLWPAPPDPMERTVEAGLKPGPKEFLVNHVHAHLDVFVDGKPIVVPAGIRHQHR